MLPNGYVSDQVNEKFSLYEMLIMRESFVSINRNNLGPGKRGSLNVKKVRLPIIRVLKEEVAPNDSYKLGFIFSGESYIIPQIVIDFNDEENYYTFSILSTFFNSDHGVLDILNFQTKLAEFLIDRKRKYVLVEMPHSTNKHFINIGMYNNKWFAATSHQIINMDYLAFEIIPALFKEFKRSVEGTKEVSIIGKKEFRYSYQFDLESVDMHFLYLKTAFNTLALVKGHDFSLSAIFNKLRDSILNCVNINQFILNEKKTKIDWVEEIIKKTPVQSHYSIVIAQGNSIYAFVSFYNETPCVINITNEYTGQSFKGGLICDWKNRREIDLSEYEQL